MAKSHKSYTQPSAKAGLPPGSLVHVGAQPALASHISLMRISSATCQEPTVANLAELLAHRGKEEMLAEHARRPNGIIVAPAMHEGLDLKGDLSRFQIIAKVPYPNFFDDKQLARRVELDRRYLVWLVALKLVQSYGRSIRSAEDWAHTYIIDGAIDRFLKEADKMLPPWFKEAIIRT